MKNVFVTIFQVVVFLLVFAAGSFLPPFHIQTVLSSSVAAGTRLFIWDGLLLTILLAALILVIEALRKRLRTAGVWTLTALVLAIATGLAAKLGFLTLSR